MAFRQSAKPAHSTYLPLSPAFYSTRRCAWWQEIASNGGKLRRAYSAGALSDAFGRVRGRSTRTSVPSPGRLSILASPPSNFARSQMPRSEERRVGKECGSRWLPQNENNNKEG